MIQETQSLDVYTSASSMAATFQAESKRILELHRELSESVERLGKAFRSNHDFTVTTKVCEAESPEGIAKELKRCAWRTLVGKLGVEKVMSSKRKEQMRETLYRNYGSCYQFDGDMIDDFPDITPESIHDVLSGFASSANDFLDESIMEEYEWLRPHCHDKHATNKENRWRVTEKVIKEWVLEKRHNKTSRFSPSYSAQSHLQSLDNIFHLLDGKGLKSEPHYGPLVSEIRQCSRSGEARCTSYFRVKCFDNRKLHLQFLRKDLLDQFNLKCGNNRVVPGRK